ncbi:MAG: glycosyltransferase family 2 protein [Candidatus Poribacteria bacterium]
MLRIKAKLPLVSVIIPVYNQEKYIKECIDSVINQSYANVEIIVVDDGSTDKTPDILRAYGDKIKYIRQENQGPSSAINNGIKSANGSLICWLGSDDLYMPNKIEHQVELLQREQSISIVYSDYITIDSYGNEINKVHILHPPQEKFARTMLIRNFINGSTVMMRRECLDKVGYYDESLRADPDGDMWFRLLKNGYKFGHISEPLVKYRLHQNNVSRDFDLMRDCKDKVRLKVIQQFSIQELFGDIIANKGSLSNAYEEVAWHLFRDFNLKSAEMALKISYDLRDKGL